MVIGRQKSKEQRSFILAVFMAFIIFWGGDGTKYGWNETSQKRNVSVCM